MHGWLLLTVLFYSPRQRAVVWRWIHCQSTPTNVSSTLTTRGVSFTSGRTRSGNERMLNVDLKTMTALLHVFVTKKWLFF